MKRARAKGSRSTAEARSRQPKPIQSSQARSRPGRKFLAMRTGLHYLVQKKQMRALRRFANLLVMSGEASTANVYVPSLPCVEEIASNGVLFNIKDMVQRITRQADKALLQSITDLRENIVQRITKPAGIQGTFTAQQWSDYQTNREEQRGPIRYVKQVHSCRM